MLLSASSYAQNGPTPEFKDKVMILASNNLNELEKTDLEVTTKQSFSARGEVNLTANGKAATLKLPGSTEETYIVKIEKGVDPANIVELFKFDEGKKNRKIMVSQYVLAKEKPGEFTKIKLSFKKYSDDTYIITTEKLEDGEYSFIVNRPNLSFLGASSAHPVIGYCFGVHH